MLRRGTRRSVPGSMLVLAFALPAAAQAADPAAATISACKRDSITVAGKVSLSRSAARKARGATLQLRFQALPFFGLSRAAAWRNSGKKTRASRQEVFTGLPADSWVGVMSWRYKKGRKTVLSGIARSQPLRVGSARGRASCTIAEGLKPVDRTPPSLFILPGDGAWHHAPATVQITASDDFSGVQSVRYSVDGGPKAQLPNGSSFTIPDQGAHTVDFEATDVAGNTAARSAVVRVDAAPPTKPAVSRPPSVTTSTTPAFQWTASTDSGAGIRGYLLTVRRPDGSVAAFQTLGPGATSTASAATLTDGETYTATVTAVDNTADLAWTTDSDAFTFRVDSNPDITGSVPANGTILSGGLKNGPFSMTLDRAADPNTVSKSTVLLDRSDGTDPANYTVKCANSPCTTIDIELTSGSLLEGHYAVRLSGVKGADEGVAFGGAVNYAVPFVESGSFGPSTSPSVLCNSGNVVPANSMSYNVSAADPGQTAFLRFAISGSGLWTMEALYGGSTISSISGGGAGSNFTLPIPIGGHTGSSLSFRLTASCSGNSVTAQNLFGSRNP